MMGGVDFRAEIILICNSLDAGGIERVVSTLANEWSRRGRRVSVVTLHDRSRFYQLDPAVHHIVVEDQGATWLPTLLRHLRNRLIEIRRLKPRLVALVGPAVYHFFAEIAYRTNFHFYLAFETMALRRELKRIDGPLVVAFGTSVNVITLKACRGMGRRVVISERNDPARLIRLWEKLWQKYYPQAFKITANTKTALRDMRDFVTDDKLAFVPNPLARPASNGNGHQVSVCTEGDHASRLILNVGRMVWDKAHEVLLEAFALLGDDLAGWRLALLGAGRLENDLRAQAAVLGISDRVDWHGVVTDPYVYYRSAAIFALPSRIEGTPNALLEAMNCGLPVIVSDGAPGPLELIKDGETGLVVPVDDPASLAAALRRLASDEALRRRLGTAARARVSEYDLPCAIAAWESVVGLT
jgi:glycosyltransferase involved in cell wall biosynthesis